MTDIASTTAGPTLDARAWAMLVALGAIWGGSFFFARIAVAEIPPLMLVLLRVSIAALALHLWLMARGIRFLDHRADFRAFMLLGLVNNAIPFSLIFYGQTELGAGLAAILNATTPFWTALLANAVTTDEKLKRNIIAGIIIGIAGTVILLGPGLLADASRALWPKLALIGATFSYAVAVVFAKRFKLGNPAVTAAGQLTASTLWMVPVVALTGTFTLNASPPVWAAVIALALVSTAFAYILYFAIIARAGATNASLVTLIVPVSAILLGVAFLGERLLIIDTAGMAIIGLGLIMIDGRLLARR
ncbi:MAG: DMT family transporter [Rhizobiaceae bacterium]|jgi:drug/metabolite transporter (DMT)-like permease|nr:DMT family transporter [Rhizobiaceae bacterium]